MGVVLDTVNVALLPFRAGLGFGIGSTSTAIGIVAEGRSDIGCGQILAAADMDVR